MKTRLLGKIPAGETEIGRHQTQKARSFCHAQCDPQACWDDRHPGLGWQEIRTLTRSFSGMRKNAPKAFGLGFRTVTPSVEGRWGAVCFNILPMLPDEEDQRSGRRTLQERGRNDPGAVCQGEETEDLNSAAVAGANPGLVRLCGRHHRQHRDRQEAMSNRNDQARLAFPGTAGRNQIV